MDFWSVIEDRRSIRQFSDRPLLPEEVERLVWAASLAPSAHNKQPWEFVFVDDPKILEAMNEGRRYASMLLSAPGAFVVCAAFPAHPRQPKGGLGVRYFCVQDCAAAVENLMLAAVSMGLGTCWIGDFDEQALSSLLHIPQGYAPVAVIAVGTPSGQPSPRRRRSVADILHWGRFGISGSNRGRE